MALHLLPRETLRRHRRPSHLCARGKIYHRTTANRGRRWGRQIATRRHRPWPIAQRRRRQGSWYRTWRPRRIASWWCWRGSLWWRWWWSLGWRWQWSRWGTRSCCPISCRRWRFICLWWLCLKVQLQLHIQTSHRKMPLWYKTLEYNGSHLEIKYKIIRHHNAKA